MSSSRDPARVTFAPRNTRAPTRGREPIPPLARLVELRAQLWNAALEPSTRAAYTRALRGWTSFTLSIAAPSFPSADSLSLFVAFRSQSVSHKTIQQDLSGLAHHYKEVDAVRWKLAREDVEVARALIGAAKMNPHSVTRAIPIPLASLTSAITSLLSSPSSTRYDDLLWAAMSIDAFFACARGQEVTAYDLPSYRDTRKYSLRSSVRLTSKGFSVPLPFHKADPSYTSTPSTPARFSRWSSSTSRFKTVDMVRMGTCGVGWTGRCRRGGGGWRR